MSRYTTTLGNILESGYDLWNFDYPIIAGYRDTFEHKFNLNFYDREINFLSVGEFQRHLMARLNLIMPYYVQLEMSEKLNINPFRNFKMEESTTRKDDTNVFSKAVETALRSELKRLHIGEDYVDNATTNGLQDGSGDEHGENNRRTDDSTHSTTDVTGTQTDDESSSTDTTGKVTENGETTDSSTKTTDETGEVHKTYSESGSDTKDTYFSDTPQENFVVGDSKGGVPTSRYATTVTNERGTYEKEGKEDTNDTRNTTETTEANGTSKKTTDSEEHQTGTQNKSSNSTTNTVGDTNSSGTVHDTSATQYTDHVATAGRSYDHSVFNRQQRNTADSEYSRIDDGERHAVLDSLTTYGYQGYKATTESALLKAFRSTFLNIDEMIFNDCETLFLGVY